MTEKQIAAVDERFGADRKVDKLATRYPHGESYLDVRASSLSPSHRRRTEPGT
jgi:hypothetical protein